MRIPKHVGNNDEADVRATDVNTIHVRDTAIARSHGNVLELDVHVVFGFIELAAIGAALSSFDGDNMTLEISSTVRYTQRNVQCS
jgi:hypothetical protein